MILTTNCVKDIGDVIQSRTSVVLYYRFLGLDTRKAIWKKISSRTTLAYIYAFIHSSVPTCRNQLRANNASCAVNLFVGSKFVKPPIISLKSASIFP